MDIAVLGVSMVALILASALLGMDMLIREKRHKKRRVIICSDPVEAAKTFRGEESENKVVELKDMGRKCMVLIDPHGKLTKEEVLELVRDIEGWLKSQDEYFLTSKDIEIYKL